MSVSSFDTLAAKVYPLLDWFIPESMKAQAEPLRRARMFLISHLFGPFLGHTISLFILFIEPTTDWAWVTFFTAITLFWAFPIALKLTGWYVPLALLSVQNLIFCILWGCYHYGGTSSPLIPWVITVPLLAFFYLGSGKAVRIFVLAIILLNLSAFYAVYSYGQGFPEHIPLAKLSGLGLVSTACAAVYVSMMALYYANVTTSQSELEREVKRRLETARQLRQATAEADRASQAKSEFLAKMSHELRTPLNAVIGYSAIMIEEMDTSGREGPSSDLKKIHNAGKRLLKLITDLLDLSKLEAGKMELFVETIEVGSLIAGVVEEFRAQIEEAGNELTIDCDASITIEGDLLKLRRILADLVSNAVKFTSHGKISIAVRKNAQRLEIAVKDTGIGIGSQKLALLFENFREFEHETSSKYGETGLGLPVSQRLCRLMGGEIAAESRPNYGSCFTVRVPTGPADGSAGARAQAAATGPASSNLVLVIDDDTSFLEEIQRVLSLEGFTVIVAAGAAEGLRLATTLQPGLILLDILMPERDGWELLTMLKADARIGTCPIVMLTVDDNVAKSRALGADGHLIKPLDKQALLAVMKELGLTSAARDMGPSAAVGASARQAA